MPPSNGSSPLSDASPPSPDLEDDRGRTEAGPSRFISPTERRRRSRSETSSTVQLRPSRDDDSDLSDLSDEEGEGEQGGEGNDSEREEDEESEHMERAEDAQRGRVRLGSAEEIEDISKPVNPATIAGETNPPRYVTPLNQCADH
jgi:hypothetical protein